MLPRAMLPALAVRQVHERVARRGDGGGERRAARGRRMSEFGSALRRSSQITKGMWHSVGSAVKAVALFALFAFLYMAGGRQCARRQQASTPIAASAERAEEADEGGGIVERGFVPIMARRADWVDGAYPRHCEEIRRNPRPYDKACKRKATAEESGDFRCSDGRVLMFSQFQQDYVLYKYHFQYLRRPGNYLDVAANEPIGLSNTYFLDKCLGWGGLCVEGNPRYFEKLHRLRSCMLLPTCVGEYDGQSVEFLLKGGSGGIESTNKGADYWRSINETVRKMRVRCTTVDMELRRYRVRVIDYMSLDVEGHELHVLHGIDWKSTRINVVSIEVSLKSYGPVQEFMTSVGYKELMTLPDGSSTRKTLGGDALFLAPDVVFGQPV